MPRQIFAANPTANRVGFAAKILLLAMLLAGVYFLGDDLTHQVRDWLEPLKGQHAFFLFLAMVLYVLFMALPFVPGIEVGLVVMLVGGPEGIALVYTATLLALSLSYGLGRLTPIPVLGGVLAWLRLSRAEALVHEMEEMTPSQRMIYLTRQIPSRWLPFFLRHRYLALAIALNTPGNALLGGGGGIGMVTGMSGLFPFPRYLALIAVAVSPVPLMLIANTN